MATKGLISAGAKKSAKEPEGTTENKGVSDDCFLQNKGNCERSERAEG
jgi:hypothetical protein